jgi:hypothetical protein
MQASFGTSLHTAQYRGKKKNPSFKNCVQKNYKFRKLTWELSVSRSFENEIAAQRKEKNSRIVLGLIYTSMWGLRSSKAYA